METLRAFELRLLRCTLPSDHPAPPSTQSPPSVIPPHPLHPLLSSLIHSVESGSFTEALSSPAAKAVFNFHSLTFTDSADSAHQFFVELLPEFVNSFVFEGHDVVDKCYRALIVMAIAVSALLAFTQCTITGPIVKLPVMPLLSPAFGEEENDVSGSWAEWEGWARRYLMTAGSDLGGKFSNLQYIVFGKVLLTRMRDLLSEGNLCSSDELQSISWWLARLLLIQQRLLDDRSASLSGLLQDFMLKSLGHFGSAEQLTSYWGSELSKDVAVSIITMLHLEAGVVELTYGRMGYFRHHCKKARVSSGLDVSVTGALGFRTVHQVEPKAQLLLVARLNSVDSKGDTETELVPALKSDNSTRSEVAFHQHPPETHEASDVLMAPRYVEDDTKTDNIAHGVQRGASASIRLKAVQQAVVLAQCLSFEKRARNDELQLWKIAPYIEAIDSQHSSHFIIKYICDILRIRWESTRNRTKQRALLMMNKLVEGLYEASPDITQRLYCCFGVNVPTIPALRKEYGNLLVSCGLIGEAVKVYEDLELWDNLIYCYRLLEKKAAAVELINMRLSEKGKETDPRLWCSLGDATNDDDCYEKAFEFSEKRSARAQRSLARSAYIRGDYETSKVRWESAMALNSLYPDGWFALGAAALKARDVDKALDGFKRAAELDPDNGEALNNIACLHMVKKKNKEAFIAFKEALKFKRNSWQMWENYSHVAADVGNFSQALEAVQKVLDMTNSKRFDAEFLERLTKEIETRASVSHFQPPEVDSSSGDFTETTCVNSYFNNVNELVASELDSAKMRETEHLVQLLGKILRQIVQSGGSSEIWGLYARWHRLRGDLSMCSEALLKQVRSYQGSDLWRDRERFEKFAHASLELCKIYQELGSRRELFAAEMHLKNTIKQAGDFSETEEYGELVARLDDVQKALQAQSVTST